MSKDQQVVKQAR